MLDCQLPPDSAQPSVARLPRKKILGFSERLEVIRAEKLARTGPDPWLARKFAVGLVIGIYAYTAWVFLARVCVPMIRRTSTQGSRMQGIAYLVLYLVSFSLFVISYARIVLTPPGFARDFAAKTEPPAEKCELVTVAGRSYETQAQSEVTRDSAELSDSTRVTSTGRPDKSDEEYAEEHVELAALGPLHATMLSPPSPVHTVTHVATPPPSVLPPAGPLPPDVDQPRRLEASASHLERFPAQNEILTDVYRYDYTEGFLRPYRSHRCRHCAAVVLNLDHHCPWVGHCVGARNKKYFYNFLQWATFFELFLFLSLIIANTLTRRGDVDRNQIAIMAISGFFLVFTTPLLAAHTRLLLLNLTTIEDMTLNRMKQRERATLAREFGTFGFKEKNEVKRRWDNEWGRIGKEGNLWHLGSKRENFEMVMGKNKWGWFLPIAASRSGDDGLSYVPNPRFSPEGIWRRRAEWPPALQ